jgi:hypothetical protein
MPPLGGKLLRHFYYNPKLAGTRTYMLEKIPMRASLLLPVDKIDVEPNIGFGLWIDNSRSRGKQLWALTTLLMAVTSFSCAFFYTSYIGVIVLGSTTQNLSVEIPWWASNLQLLGWFFEFGGRIFVY